MTKVFIDTLTIPDRADGGKMRIAVQMIPTADIGPGGSIDADDWHDEVLLRARKVRLWVAGLSGGAPDTPRVVDAGIEFETDLARIFPAAPGDQTLLAAAKQKWRDIFPPGDTQHPVITAIAHGKANSAQLAASAAHRVLSLPASAIEKMFLKTYAQGLTAAVDRATAAARKGAPAGQPVTGVGGWRTLGRLLQIPEAAPERSSTRRQAVGPALSAAEIMSAMPGLMQDPTKEARVALALTMQHTIDAVQADSPPPGLDKPAPPPDKPEPGEPALRKLFAVLGFPGLAKYLGLCADLLVDPAKLGNLRQGLIAVEVSDGAGNFAPSKPKLAWAAFEAEIDASGATYFGSWDGKPVPATAPPEYVRGLLNLRPEDYNLGSSQSVHWLLRLHDKIVRELREINAGRRLDTAAPKLPQAATAGLILRHTSAVDRFNKQRAGSAPVHGADVINYTESLHHGLRFDVLLEPLGKAVAASRWRPLMARDLAYGLPDAFTSHSDVVAVRYREDGSGRTPAGAVPTSGASAALVAEELMQWRGGSLALSNDAKPAPSKDDVATDITFKPSDGAARKPPPLRYGRSYRVRARIVLPMGCGPRLEDADAFADSGRYALPATSAPAYVYKRFEPVGAPIIALPWNSPIVTDRDPPKPPPKPKTAPPAGGTADPPLPATGRAHDEIVIMDGKSHPLFLLPARLPLDDAEQQCQFDAAAYHGVPVPPGAFENDLPLVLFGPDGRMPEARDGAIVWKDVSEGETAPWQFYGSVPPGCVPETAQARGAVFVPDPAAAAEQRQKFDSKTPGLDDKQPRYYPDLLARAAIARLQPVPGFCTATDTLQVEFWLAAATPADAVPIVLQAMPGTGCARFAAASTYRVKGPNQKRAVKLPRVTVTLPAGEMIDVSFYADTRQRSFADQHEAGLLAQGAGAEDHFVPHATDVRTIRLVHPVARPLGPPAIVGLQLITRTVAAEGSGDLNALPSWSQIAAPPAKPVSEQGGLTTFFTGTLTAPARSTGKLRCEARWNDYGEGTIQQDALTGLWSQTAPLQFARLFGVDVELGGDTIDLLNNPRSTTPATRYRGLAYSFKDGRARRLQLRLVGTSRFTGYYPPEPVSDSRQDIEELGVHDIASNVFDPEAKPHWLQCTFRPPPPSIDRALPVTTTLVERKSRALFTFSRAAISRLFLGPDWYASGEGELLGVVFDKATVALCDYDLPAHQPFARFLTRWGSDPIRSTDPVTALTPARVAGSFAPIEADLLPGADDLARSSKDVEARRPVIVKVLQPLFDMHLGLYCDIEIAAAEGQDGSYMPFLQLGLARYQPHAVADLTLSRPVNHIVQLLPARSGEVSFLSPKRIQVTLAGPHYDQLDVTLGMRLDVTLLVRRELETGSGQPTGNWTWVPADHDGTSPDQINIVPLNQAGQVIWRVEVDLPTWRDDDNYGVRIEEFEVLPGDPESDAVPISPVDPLLGTSPRRRGPLFAVMIDLGL